MLKLSGESEILPQEQKREDELFGQGINDSGGFAKAKLYFLQ